MNAYLFHTRESKAHEEHGTPLRFFGSGRSRLVNEKSIFGTQRRINKPQQEQQQQQQQQKQMCACAVALSWKWAMIVVICIRRSLLRYSTSDISLFSLNFLEMLRAIKKGGNPPLRPIMVDTKDTPIGYKELMERCWSHYPIHRPPIKEVGKIIYKMQRESSKWV